MPYMYALALAASSSSSPPSPSSASSASSSAAAAAEPVPDSPVVRPTFWDFGASDSGCWGDCDDFMVGPFLLACPVVTPGERCRAVRLPRGPPCWYDFYTEERVFAPRDESAEQFASLAAPMDRVPLLCPAGALIPMTNPSLTREEGGGGSGGGGGGDGSGGSGGGGGGGGGGWLPAPAGAPRTHPHDEPSRVLRAFPFPSSGRSSFSLPEDDGLAPGPFPPRAVLTFTMECTEERIAIACEVTRSGAASTAGAFPLPYDVVCVSLPAWETRPVILRSGGRGAPRLVCARFVHQPL